MKNNKESILIVLPCLESIAKFASYSAELAQISDDMNVIDSSFRHILKSKLQVKVILVAGPGKKDVVEFVKKKYSEMLDLEVISLNTPVTSIFSTLTSLESKFKDKNLVLIPNLIVQGDFINEMVENLNSQEFVCVYKMEKSVVRIKNYDSVLIRDKKAVKFGYKPKNPKDFNGISVSFGFVKDAFKKLSDSNVTENTKAVEIKDFSDVSSWTQYNAYLLKQYLKKSGIDSELLDH